MYCSTLFELTFASLDITFRAPQRRPFISKQKKNKATSRVWQIEEHPMDSMMGDFGMTTEAKLSDIPEELRISEEQAYGLLLKPTGELSDNLVSILHCLFTRFTQPSTTMSVAQMHTYSRVCNNGEPFSEAEIDEIQTHFDCDQNQHLTRTGFLQMYHTQTNGDIMETWKDLIKFGYGPALLNGMMADTTHLMVGTLPCQVCGKPGRFTCKRCQLARYCSRECQIVDWKKIHKEVCISLPEH